MRTSLSALLVCIAGSGFAQMQTATLPSALRTGGLVVVAPHPDDEALIAGGSLARAVANGEPVAVLILTSGDYDCRSAASQRQAESVAGLAALGVKEDQIFFLGYPDGYLSRLGLKPLPPVRRLIDGVCARGNTTYGERGAGNVDVHRARTGTAAEYTAPNLVADLHSLLQSLSPRELIVTHPADSHPDHAAAYAFVRRALNGLPRAPRLLRAFVHGDDCWPTGGRSNNCLPGRIAPREATPPLTGLLRGYLPNLRLAVPASCLRQEVRDNPKLAAISAHVSQTRGSASSYLLAFARRDEPFFEQQLRQDAAGNWVPLAAPRSLRPATFRPLGQERLALLQHIPLALEVTLTRPVRGKPVRVSFLETAQQRYVLDFDGQGPQVSLRKQTAAGEASLKQWPLPHDAWAATERFELQVTNDASTGGAAELTLFLDGELVGVAVDPKPIRDGIALSVDDPSGSKPALSLSLGACADTSQNCVHAGRDGARFRAP
ncbi:MAG: PIG-L family deacetylase [Polyangiaceae bacterium]